MEFDNEYCVDYNGMTSSLGSRKLEEVQVQKFIQNFDKHVTWNSLQKIDNVSVALMFLSAMVFGGVEDYSS